MVSELPSGNINWLSLIAMRSNCYRRLSTSVLYKQLPIVHQRDLALKTQLGLEHMSIFCNGKQTAIFGQIKVLG